MTGGVLGPTFLVLDQDKDQRRCILKVIEHAQLKPSEELRQQFEALMRLRHPNLTPYEDLVWNSAHVALVRPFVQGQPLLEYLHQGQALDKEAAHHTPKTQEVEAKETPDDALDALDALAAELDNPLTPTDLNSKLLEEQLQDIADESASELGEIIGHVARQSLVSEQTTLKGVLQRLQHILPQLLSALEFLKRYRKCHGELHPHNVLVDAQGVCHIIEYGLTPLLPDHDSPNSSDIPLEDYHRSMWRRYRSATPYFAPEVILESDYSAAADIYSVGCLIFEALAHRAPYSPIDLEQDLLIQRANMPSLLELQPQCPSFWAELLQHMLSVEIDERPDASTILTMLHEQDETIWAPTLLPPSFVAEPVTLSGRDELVEALLDQIEREHIASAPPIYLVEGVEGAGKHHLTERVSYELARRGWSVLQANCGVNEAEPMLPWRMLAIQLRDLLSHCPEQLRQEFAATATKAQSVLPDLGGATIELPDDQIDLELARAEAVDALRRLLANISHERPLLLVLPDLHQFSQDALDLLHDLRASPQETRCAILATSLPGQPWSAPHQEHALWRFQTRAFTPAEARTFLKPLCTSAVFEAFEPLLAQDRPRSPLLLKELLFDYTHRAEAETDAKLQAEPLQTLYLRRISELKPRERELLEVIALSLGALRTDVLQQMGIPQLDEVILKLSTVRLIKRTHTALSHTPAYRTSHAIIREVVLKTCPQERRLARYQALAKATEKTFGGLMAMKAGLAFELWRASLKPRKAALYAQDAIDEALRHQAYHRAALITRWRMEHHHEISDEPLSEPELLAQIEATAALYMRARRPEEAARCCETSKHPTLSAAATRRLEELQLWYTLMEGKIEQAKLMAQAQRDQSAPRALAQTLGWLARAGRARAYRAWRAQLTRDDNTHTLTSPWAHPSSHGWLMSTQLLAQPLFESADSVALFLPPGSSQPSADARADRERAFLAQVAFFEAMLELDYKRIKRNAARQLSALAQRPLAQDTPMRGLVDYIAGRWELTQGRYDLVKARQRASLPASLSWDEPWGWVRVKLYGLYGQAALELGDLEGARAMDKLLVRQERELGGAKIASTMLKVGIGLTSGELGQAQQALDRLRQSQQAPPRAWAEVWIVCQQARVHMAAGRAEVAAGQLEILLERLEQQGLSNQGSLQVKVLLRLAQALTRTYMVEHTLHEAHQARSLERLKQALTTLQRRRAHLNAIEQIELIRLSARVKMLKKPQGLFKRRALHQALRIIEGGIAQMVKLPNALEQAKCAEARGLILVELEAPEGRELIHQAYKIYEHLGIYSPLHLEGWPLPKSLSALQED